MNLFQMFIIKQLLIGTLIGLGIFGLVFLSHKRPPTDSAMKRYSANTPRFIKTNVS